VWWGCVDLRVLVAAPFVCLFFPIFFLFSRSRYTSSLLTIRVVLKLNEWSDLRDIRPWDPTIYRFYLPDPCTAVFLEVRSSETEGLITLLSTNGPFATGQEAAFTK
jgi:hypothetical protein